MKALMRVCFGLVLAIGLTAGLGCSQNAGKCCGQCKAGKACPAGCKKPCCVKGAKCPADCKKACCANRGANCPADCRKACCKDRNKPTTVKPSTVKPSTGTGSMTPKPMGS